MNGADILKKAEEQVLLIKSRPFEERLAAFEQQRQRSESGETPVLMPMTKSDIEAMILGQEMIKAFGNVSRADDGEPEEPREPSDDDEEQDDDGDEPEEPEEGSGEPKNA